MIKKSKLLGGFFIGVAPLSPFWFPLLNLGLLNGYCFLRSFWRIEIKQYQWLCAILISAEEIYSSTFSQDTDYIIAEV